MKFASLRFRGERNLYNLRNLRFITSILQFFNSSILNFLPVLTVDAQVG